jgi:chloramphenicol-sensitive protein RarD
MNDPPSAPGESRLALTAGLGCYLIWGAMPLIFQTLTRQGAGALEVLAHRTVWALPLAAVFVLAARQSRQAARVLRTPRTLAWLALSSTLIAVNWGVFIWAATDGRVLETSLGYYINPLVSMAAGAVIFRERIDRLGQAAIGLAAVGVTLQALALGHLPLVPMVLAFSFAGYAVVRKRVAAEAQTGLFVECLILGAPALAYVLWLEHAGLGHFRANPAVAAWLVVAGVVTATPLMLFAWATRRMSLQAMGFLQFLTPTITFFLGVAQGEPFTPLRAASFVFIWGGAALFVWGAWRRARRVASYASAA